jgi:uracil-DNA glycosylase
MTLKRSCTRDTADDRVEPTTVDVLNAIIAASKPLVPGATRAVLGEGTIGASIAFVGEQPGDQEDRQGRPFVGPAGQLLDRAMSDAGIDRRSVYGTNAIKHFKFEQRGKRRIHQKPTAGEVRHYRLWLDQELRLVRPKLVVALGATAVLALAGKPLPIERFRGRADLKATPASSRFIHRICCACRRGPPRSGHTGSSSKTCEVSANLRVRTRLSRGT